MLVQLNLVLVKDDTEQSFQLTEVKVFEGDCFQGDACAHIIMRQAHLEHFIKELFRMERMLRVG